MFCYLCWLHLQYFSYLQWSHLQCYLCWKHEQCFIYAAVLLLTLAHVQCLVSYAVDVYNILLLTLVTFTMFCNLFCYLHWQHLQCKVTNAGNIFNVLLLTLATFTMVCYSRW